MSATRPAQRSPEAAVASLPRLVFRLRRALNQSGGASLPFAKLEVLRLVHRSPGLRVQDVAQALGIAPNTASTLVKQLAEMGLVERRHDAADARAVRLYPTALALARKASRHDRRDAALSAALQSLGRDERELIESALPALNRLLEALESRA
jgi:DNA-binding MarR family transcriptional regulator